MESTKKTKLTALIFSLLFVCLALFILTPAAHAEEAAVAPKMVTLSADLTDDTLIASQKVYTEYEKFSDFGLKVKNDDPGFITPLHVLIQYYLDVKGATRDTISQYIQVDKNGNLLELEGYDGGRNVDAAHEWIYSLGNYFRGDDNNNKVFPITDIPVDGTVSFIGINKNMDPYYYEYAMNSDNVVVKGESTSINFRGVAIAPTISFNKVPSMLTGCNMTGATEWVKKVAADGSMMEAEKDKDYTLTGTINKMGMGWKFTFNEAGTYYVGADKLNAPGDKTTNQVTHNTAVYVVKESSDLVSDYSSIKDTALEIGSKPIELENYSKGSKGSEITWTASDARVHFEKSSENENDLLVKADIAGLTENTPVLLTATVNNGSEMLTKKLSATLVVDDSRLKLNNDLNSITWTGKETLNNDIEYSKDNANYTRFFTGANGTNFTWQSSDPELLDVDMTEEGKLKLTIMRQPEQVERVTLTITGTLDGQSSLRRVSCWVVPLTDKAIVAKDLANTDINLKEFSNVHQTKTAYLCKGQYGSEKVWSCSEPSLLTFEEIDDNNLKITANNANLTEDKKVQLICTVSYGEVSEIKSFEAMVYASLNLSTLNIEGIEGFMFDPTVSAYNFTMLDNQEITVSSTPLYADAYVEVDGLKLASGEKYTYKVKTDQSNDRLNLVVKRDNPALSKTYALNFFKQASELPNYTAQWGMGHYNYFNIRAVEGYSPRSSAEINLEKTWFSKISNSGPLDDGVWGKWSYPIIVNNNIYVAGDNNLFKFDMEGNQLAQTKMTGGVLGGGYTGWLAYGDGMIFVPGGNNIMAFNADDLSQLWTSKTEIPTIQGSCPILYKDGYVYSGTTEGTGGGGGYYCFDTKDDDPTVGNEVKEPIWVLQTNEEDGNSSFYWAGATIVEEHLIVPNDSGNIYSIDMKASIEQKTPVIIEKLNNDGKITNVRTSVAYDETTKSIYYPTYNNKTYKVVVNDDGTFGDVKSIDIGGSYCQNPIVYNGRLYLQNNVVDANTMELIYTANVGVGAAAQGAGGWTVATTYKGNDQTIYIYGHTGSTINVWKDSPQNNAENPATIEKLWDNNLQPQATTCNLVIAPDGALVFVNDSARLFCLKSSVTQEQVEAEKTYQGIIDKIEALPEADKVQLSDKANIEAVRTAYKALSAENQAKVTNYQKLVDCEIALKNLQEAVNKAAAAKVDALIADLPQPENLVYNEHKEAVNAAKDAFDKLTETQKALVTNIDKLNVCIEKMEELKTLQGSVTFDIERFTIGQGYFVEPIQVPFYDGDNARTILQRVIGEENCVGEDNYLKGIKGADAGVDKVVVPDYISKLGVLAPTTETARQYGNAYESNILGEHSYDSMSGWMYAVNNQFPNFGISDYTPKDGDVLRFQFTLWGTGMDLTGQDYNSGEVIADISNKDVLTKALAAVNSGDKEALLKDEGVKAAYEKAMEIAPQMTAPQAEVDAAAEALNEAVTAVKEAGDRAAAQKAADEITALPAVNQLTLNDKAAVEAARAQYNSLTETQRSYISDDVLKILEAAEAQIAKLEEEASKPDPTPTPKPSPTPEISGGSSGSENMGSNQEIEIVTKADGNARTGITDNQATAIWGAAALLAIAGIASAVLIHKRKKS